MFTKLRPRELADPVVRYETPAGRQGQVDFGSFSLPWGRRYALLVVLSNSRLLWLRLFWRQTMEVLFLGPESAFERFGGVPQELLFDQMRSVVVSDHSDQGGGTLVLNTEFQRFARHWGFRTRLCRPSRFTTPALCRSWCVTTPPRISVPSAVVVAISAPRLMMDEGIGSELIRCRTRQ